MRSVVITGVSTGIGYAAAETLVRRGFRVFGSVRRQEDAERLEGALGERFQALLFDVTDETRIREAAECVRAALGNDTLAGLVNNAGIAVSGPLLELAPDDYRRQLDVNLVGPFLVTRAFAPLLGAEAGRNGPAGRVVNISSAAGLRAMPFLGPYSASKFGLEGFSEALRRELMLFGIDVVIVGPGPVKTPIWDKADEVDLDSFAQSPFFPALKRFRGVFLEQGRNGLPAERLGELIHEALTTPSPKVRYAAVKGRLGEKLLTPLLSRRAMDRMIARMLGLAKTS